jgi:DNA-binding beta-propeller fold protein YncE
MIPAGIAIDQDDNVYVGEQDGDRIQKFSPTGDFLLSWGGSGSGLGQLDHPGGLTVDEGGRIYVCDRWNDRVQVFDSVGGFLFSWGSSGSGNGQFDYPSGIDLGPDGSIYVMDGDNNRVHVFTGCPDEEPPVAAMPVTWGRLKQQFAK